MSEQEKLNFLASAELLSLADAAKLTPYSVEYISYLARRNRIPAAKIGRNWLTTRKAILSYLQEQQAKHHNMALQFQQLQKGVI